MKKFFLLIILSLLIASPFKSFGVSFPEKSILSSGRWVRIAIEESGIYEIPYSQLQEMGFSEPSKVAIFGNGGVALPRNFKDQTGADLISFEKNQIPVAHKNNKLIFFGIGPEQISTDQNANNQVVFMRTSRNEYSKYGYYLLTDSQQPKLIQKANSSTSSSAKNIEIVLGYAYFEKDLLQNHDKTGTLFWTHPINRFYKNRATMPYRLYDADLSKKANMQCYVYLEKDINGTLSYGPESGGSRVSAPFSNPATTIKFQPLNPSSGDLNFPTEEGTIKVEIENPDDYIDIGGLDYWLITYPRFIPSLKDESQTSFCIDNLKPGEGIKFNLSSSSHSLFAISNKGKEIVEIPVETENGKATITFNAIEENQQLALLNPEKQLLQIKNYEPVSNLDILANDYAGVELLIITPKELIPYANKIAQLHKIHDGFETAVFSLDDIYNEFNSGCPDPMAYRSIVKLIRDKSDKSLKNVLLLGPMNSDLVTKGDDINPFETHIAYQAGNLGQNSMAYNCNEFYALLDDYTNKNPYQWTNMIGLGILPVHDQFEAERIVRKIENYLTSDSHSFTLNRFISSGGAGDNHTHAKLSTDMASALESYGKGRFIPSLLISSAYHSKESAARFVEALDNCALAFYSGHGNPTVIDSSKKIFSTSDIRLLSNQNLPFMMFAGCNISNTDSGKRGIGESMLLDTDHGIMGGIIANRDTYANLNQTFFKSLVNLILSQPHNDGKTIGELFAQTKAAIVSQNDLAYNLYCDPSLKIIVPSDEITLQKSTLDSNGKLNLEGTLTEGFNGKITASLFSPRKTLVSQNIGTTDKEPFSYDVDDEIITSFTGTVENGKFKISIPFPRSAFEGNPILSLSAYDASQKKGEALVKEISLNSLGNEGSKFEDVTPPSVESFSFNYSSNTLSVKVSDDYALAYHNAQLPANFVLTIDGKESVAARHVARIPVADEIAYTANIILPELASGTHSLTLSVADLAGNRSSHSIRINPADGQAKVTPTQQLFYDMASFIVDGLDPDEYILCISDINGNPVKRLTSNQWDLTDENNNPVADGIYSVSILNSFPDKKISSQSSRFSVVKAKN